jgi:hypothetical protein
MENISEKFIFMSAILMLIRGVQSRGTELKETLNWLDEIIKDHEEEIKKQNKNIRGIKVEKNNN